MQPADDYSAQTALEAHRLKINGVSSPAHDLDNAGNLLNEAHGVLAACNLLLAEYEGGLLNPKLLAAALNGAERLLEQGIRDLTVGYREMLSEVRTH
ncbi:hypothetical protein [Rhizorhabdus histidinilytica]|uniref:hypothetical protein n=1 Tax=Rhizorhabdus histidinilytica TaxID=439228 RepID=UPI00063FD14A|nr:hypothetical protein [Sphingomonas sp. Y57]